MKRNPARAIVIGDVHGCLVELLQLLDAVKYRQRHDTLIFTGDLVDRGPDSVGVVRLARALGAMAVKGNHDNWHVRWARHEAARLATGKPHPMRIEARSRELNENLRADGALDWLGSLPLSIRYEDWTIVHAGCLPGIPVVRQLPGVLMYVRYVNQSTGKTAPGADPGVQPPGSVFWTKLWEGEPIIYGHNVHDLDDPRVDGNCVGIDTGCVFGGHLTAAVVRGEDLTFMQVPAQRAYAEFTATRELA